MPERFFSCATACTMRLPASAKPSWFRVLWPRSNLLDVRSGHAPLFVDACVPDDLAHSRHFGFHSGCELRRRTADGVDPGVEKFLSHIRLIKYPDNVAVEQVDDRRRSFGRSENADQRNRFVTRQT